jgi:FG-GAP-like repeat
MQASRHWRYVLALLALFVSSGASCASGRDQATATPSGSDGSQGGAGGDWLGSGGGAGGGSGGALVPGEECVFVPTPGQFEPVLDCAWNGPAPGSAYPELGDVVATPVVINLTDDNGDMLVDSHDIPDIAFISFRASYGGCPAGMTCGCCASTGVLRVLSGACSDDGAMTEHFTVGPDEIQADGFGADVHLDYSGGLAAGDIDADGSPDLVATTLLGGTIAFEANGTVKWRQPNHPGASDHLAGTTPAIADLDQDGKPEIISGRIVLNGEDGSLAWAGNAGIGTNGFIGPVSVVADVDLDGKLNVVAGDTMYDHLGNVIWSFNFPMPIDASTCQAAGFPCDGFTAVGNFDADEEGEVVIVRAGIIYILNHDGTAMQMAGAPAQIDLPTGGCFQNEGGPPTLADFDGDGQTEIGVASANFYVVADLECLASPLPSACSDRGIRWKLPNLDCSSRVTGSSVFDFDGDGRAEVIYNDEVQFRILDGLDGSVLHSLANASVTRLEMPIVADVDNDGNAEIVFIENAPFQKRGIRVWADATDSWVPTRRIWNQHAYHITNVNEDGSIPIVEAPHWLASTDSTVSGTMNSFRQNLPEFDVLAAPDLTVSLSVDKTTCPDSLGLVGTVCNEGLVVVGAGVEVAFWDNPGMAPMDCVGGVPKTQFPLEPGACETVTCALAPPPSSATTVDVRACVDNEGYDCVGTGAAGQNNECNEDNNTAELMETGCEVLM